MSPGSESFNLLDEPWIPCIPLDGGLPHELGLRETLLRAHELRQLSDSSPLVTVALHRLLLAIVHRVFGPTTEQAWRDLRRAGAFNRAEVSSYLERWQGRFDLFDATRPFYQVSPIDGAKVNAVAKLAPELASGNNITLFDHTTGGTAAFTPAQAARNLVAFQVFAVGGGMSDVFPLSDAPLARDYLILLRGDSLFETLVLNMVRYTREAPLPWVGEDLPWWERDTFPAPEKAGTVPLGYLDYLTWQSRRVHLVRDQDGLVRTCQIRQNYKLPGDWDGFDPFKPYRRLEQGGYVPRRFAEERTVWRDSYALLETAEDSSFDRRPAVFDWLAQAETTSFGKARQRARTYTFDVLGYLTDGPQAKLLLWRHEHLPLPIDYLTQKPLRDKLREGIALAEEVSDLFHPAFVRGDKTHKSYPRPLWVLAEALLAGLSGRTPDKRDIQRLTEHLGMERAYWSALDSHFRRFMVDLAADEGIDIEGNVRYGTTVFPRWAEEVGQVAREVFSEGLRSLESNARTLRATALAERAFGWQIAQMLAPLRPEQPSLVTADTASVSTKGSADGDS